MSEVSVIGSPVDPCDFGPPVPGPVVAPSPRGSLSVVRMVDDPDPVRWAPAGARYERAGGWASPDNPYGAVLLDCNVPCPELDIADYAEAEAGFADGHAQAYLGWFRWGCDLPLADVEARAADAFAVREEAILDHALVALAQQAAPIAGGADAVATLIAVERAIAERHAGQATIFVNYETLYALNDALDLVNGSLLTMAGNRVATSPLFTLDFAAMPNLTVRRSSVETFDLFTRGTNATGALVQRYYLLTADPNRDIVTANIT